MKKGLKIAAVLFAFNCILNVGVMIGEAYHIALALIEGRNAEVMYLRCLYHRNWGQFAWMADAIYEVAKGLVKMRNVSDRLKGRLKG